QPRRSSSHSNRATLMSDSIPSSTSSIADSGLIFSYAGLLLSASATIYVGAHASLPSPRKHKGSSQDIDHDQEDDGGDEEESEERLSSADAWLFPIMGSCVLVGLYLVIKYFGPGWINWVLGWYFALAGIGAVWKSYVGLLRWTVGEARWRSYPELAVVFKQRQVLSASQTEPSSQFSSGSASPVHAPVKTKSQFSVSPLLTFKVPSLLLLPFSAAPSLLYILRPDRTALLTNLLGIAFAQNAIALLKLDGFRTGCILLSALFFYDIWWVFGTRVMVEVATNLDVPIKLIMPKAAQGGYTMLGLGDIVIPGVFIALCLRFDHHRAERPVSSTFSRPYFLANLFAYISGLVTTMIVMHAFGKAQPALLYLSPACIGAFLLTAAFRNELSVAWKWEDKSTSDLAEELEEKNK
ncbi:unnamed protein product, partial [Mycena citricolor]